MCSMQDYHNQIPLVQKWVMCFPIFLGLAVTAMMSSPLFAQSSSQQLQIKYSDGLVSMSVKDTDIKVFLRELSEKTGVYIEYPSDIEKNITMDKKGVSLEDFFLDFLRNMSYALILSGADLKRERVTKVYIYPDSTGSSLSDSDRDRIVKLIEIQEEKIEETKQRLEEVGEDSSTGEAYLRRIRLLEESIESYKKRL